MKVADLREQRALRVAEARALVDKAGAEKRNLTADEQKAFDGLKASITDLEAQEQRAVFLESAERRSLGTPDKARNELEGQVNVLDAIACQIENRSASGALAEFQA